MRGDAKDMGSIEKQAIDIGLQLTTESAYEALCQYAAEINADRLTPEQADAFCAGFACGASGMARATLLGVGVPRAPLGNSEN